MRAFLQKTHRLMDMLLVLLATNIVSAADYFVSTTGSDTGPGTLSQPFRTIQKAADQVSPGDKVYVMSGTYRETVTVTRSGTAAAPITFQPYQGAQVTITGLDVLNASWTPYAGATYGATVTSSVSQLFANGQMMQLARFPNAGYNNPLRANVATIDSAAIQPAPATSTITSNSLSGTSNFAGGKVAVPSGGQYVTVSAPVTGQSGNTLNVQWPAGYSNSVYSPTAGNNFYVYGTLAALNSQKEWYYDASASKLYLQALGGANPASQTVEVRNRQFGFDIRNFTSYIQVSGFRFQAAGINVAGNYNSINNVQVLYGDAFTDPAGWNGPNDPAAVRISGHHNTVQNSEIAYTWGDGVRLAFSSNTINNIIIHDVNWGGTDAAFINADGSGGRNAITNNTMYNAGRSGVTYRYTNPDTKIEHNDISRYGYLTADLGGIYTFQGQNSGSVVAYNRVHDDLAAGTNAGIYMDAESSGVTAHHNLVYNTQIGILLFPDGHNFYNNTLWNVNTAMLAAGGTSTNTNTVNNLSNTGPWLPAGGAHHNRTQSSNPFVNSATGDFALRSGTTPVDFGVLIPGITDGYQGSAPDAGAFEFGSAAWTAGANFRTWLFPNQVAAPLTSALYVTQSGQRVTTGPLVTGNVSSTTDNNRAFLKFDLTGVPQEIASATLRIYESDAPTSGNGAVKLLRVLSSWTPENVAYEQAVDTATQISGFYDPANLDLYTDIDVSSIVRNWLSDPSTNFGFSLYGTEGITGTAKFFEGLYGVTPPQLVITLTSANTLAGDFDGDSDVDGADFVIWQTHFPTSSGATRATGDADGDGDVDGADFVVWQTNFPTIAGASSFLVPEPMPLVLFLTGVIELGLFKFCTVITTARGCERSADRA